MTIHDEEGWDSLAENLGLEAAPEPKKEPKIEPKPIRAQSKIIPTRSVAPIDEPEDADGGFGLGIAEEPALEHTSTHSPTQPFLYDPGPDVVFDQDDDDTVGEAPEPLEDSEDETSAADQSGETQEGGKKKRRRRRRRKKKSDAEPVGATGEPTAVEPENGGPAESGENGDVEDAEYEDVPDSEDDGEEDTALPVQKEWNVMTWLDLVAKLHRPG